MLIASCIVKCVRLVLNIIHIQRVGANKSTRDGCPIGNGVRWAQVGLRWRRLGSLAFIPLRSSFHWASPIVRFVRYLLRKLIEGTKAVQLHANSRRQATFGARLHDQ